MIPVSLAFEVAPEFNSNKLSSNVVLVEFTVVVEPLTVKLPPTTMLPELVTFAPLNVNAVVDPDFTTNSPELFVNAPY